LRVRVPVWLRFALGLLFALLALVVAWWPRPERTALNAAGQRVPELSLVLAARDIEYCGPATPCGPGRRTDTIFYLRLVGRRAYAVAIPRDLRVELPGYQGKINAVYGFLGAEGLERAVEQVIGLKVEHHVILTLDLVRRVVDALGGVEVYLPAPMDYDDNAANLHIHLPAGRQTLNGEEAVGYMRFRGWEGSDLGRLDRIKGVLIELVKKATGPAYWPRLPGILRQVWADLETDLSLDQALVFLPYLRGLELSTATLPVREAGPYLVVDDAMRARFLRDFFGIGLGEAVPVPEARVLILDGSGAGLGARFAEGLARLGLPRPRVVVIGPQPVSRVVVDRALFAGRYYAEAVHLPLVTRFKLHVPAEVAIVLGRDLTIKTDDANDRRTRAH